jgi:hypothetical protein
MNMRFKGTVETLADHLMVRNENVENSTYSRHLNILIEEDIEQLLIAVTNHAFAQALWFNDEFKTPESVFTPDTWTVRPVTPGETNPMRAHDIGVSDYDKD